MILYELDSGEFVGTQEEAKKKAPHAWRKVDVPTSKPELLEYLNARVPAREQEAAPSPDVPVREPGEWDRCPKCNQTHRLASFYAGLEGAKAIREAILTCDAQFVNGHVDAVIDRLKAMKENPDG